MTEMDTRPRNRPRSSAVLRSIRVSSLSRGFAYFIPTDQNNCGRPLALALKLRPTGLGSGIDKDRPDYTVYCGGWDVGRIYQTRGGPESLRWFWSLTVNGPNARGSGGDIGRGQGAVSEELGRVEGVGEVGGGSLTSLSPLAALPNWRRFFVNLLRGVTPFRRDRYCR